RNLTQLHAMWGEVKADIRAVRAGAPADSLLRRSEAYFKLANDTVFAAEAYSNLQTKRLTVLIAALIVAMLFTWSCLLSSYLRRLLHLETTNRDLSDKVSTDALTGAPNFECFRLRGQTLLSQQPTAPCALFFLDIDNFKYYNHVFGAQYGDEILKKYAQLLRASLEPAETFCRATSDHFLVLRHYRDRAGLIGRQEAVDRQIADFVLATRNQHLFTLSCGICCADDLTGAPQIDHLIEHANFARKTAKLQSLTHYAFYNEHIRDKMLTEKAIENQMQAALSNREFVVFLQPKVSLETGQIACAEALVRWTLPGGRLVPPDVFIPIFEKSLLISALDQYVMEEVCRWLRGRLDEGLSVLPVSVNVSRMQLYSPDFVRCYTDIRDRYGIPPHLLEIEFTESMIFENVALFLHIISALKQAGFLCSLDDFGKGYSSLNLLRNLPVDVLKLDKLFFDADDQMEKSRIIIGGIVTMAKQLSLKIV
ncbi:MAG: bifunctional diguanylate cyclase/phosphodiesterase, partial [Oscillospiraceae bacterium]